MTAGARVVLWLAALTLVAGCGSSSSGDQPGSASARPAEVVSKPAVSPKSAYARAQADALGRIDYASGEVLYLDPAHTGPAVLGQKVHSLTAALRRAARDISKLQPPAGAGPLQRREVAQLRAYARRLDAWVRTHPKRTVSAAGDVVHSGSRGVDRAVDALVAKGLAN